MRARISTLMGVAVMLTACGVVTPTPTPSPPMLSFEVLVDIGIFGGPPDLPPPYAISALTDDTQLLLVDRGATQHLREVRWNGTQWESVGGIDARLIPANEDGPYVVTMAVGPDQGLSAEAVLVVARVPNGPINRVELELDGETSDVWLNHPLTLEVLPGGTEVGESFRAFDAGTLELDSGPIHHE